MTRASQYYPRWRSLLMQTIMWVVLGGTVALAALLDRHLLRAQILTLSDPIVDGPLTFRFPATWKNWTRQVGGDATAHVATDSDNGISRTLIVSRQRVPHFMSPAEYMLRVSPLSGTITPDAFKGVTIDGWPGQLLKYAGRLVSFSSGTDQQFTVCSAIVLPIGQTIMIRLDKNAPFDQADDQLYKQILDQVSASATRPSEGGSIQLTDNIQIDVPPELGVNDQPDPLRHSRSAAGLTDEGGWISAVFIPVMFSGSEPSPSLLAGLAAREQLDSRDPSLADRWITAEVSAQGPNNWTIDPQDPPDEVITGHRVAHLLTGDGGQGVIVVLNAATPAPSSDLDHLWDELGASIHIGKSPPLIHALETGAALLRKTPAPASGDSWGLWFSGSAQVGFTHDYVEKGLKSALRYTVRRNWNGTATAVDQQWGASADSGPWATMTRADAEGKLDSPLAFFFGEATTSSADWIITNVRDRAGHETSNSNRFNPAAFVLSRYLPQALYSVTKLPTAFWTDRFVGVEGEHFPTPLLLLAHRVESGGRLRCVEAEVNGTGEVSRWYFAPDGAFDHADFAGDLHLRPSNQAAIESAFAGDHRLTPQAH
jgi:hypothetical protein